MHAQQVLLPTSISPVTLFFNYIISLILSVGYCDSCPSLRIHLLLINLIDFYQRACFGLIDPIMFPKIKFEMWKSLQSTNVV